VTDYSELVERLRRRTSYEREAAAAIEAQREWIEWLEGSLQRIATHDWIPEYENPVLKLRYIARAALEEKS